jgi:general secretion pathway protein A
MMFTTHFKMKAHPFQEHTPTDHILQDARMREGLARMTYLAEAGTIGLVTGHTGVGKSSLIRLFVQSLSRNRYLPLYVYLTHVGVIGLLKLIVMSLGEKPKRGKEHLFLQILEKVHETELTTLLIVDEAQFIEPEALIDLRLLVSSALDEGARLKILLSGQETLREQLKRSAHADLVHRITVRYHLPPLTKDQTFTYIDHHMKKAGTSNKVFEAEAKTLIHDYASGLPRQINTIATACLINAASKSNPKIDGTLVNETMGEIHLP